MLFCATTISAVGQDTQSTSATAREDSWRLFLRLQETGSTNPDAALYGTTVSSDIDKLILDSLGVFMSFDRQRKKGRVAVSGRAMGNLFRDSSYLNNLGLGGSISGYYTSSPRLTWVFGEDFSTGGLSQELLFNEGINLIAPNLRSTVSLTRAGLSYMMSSRTMITADFGFDWVKYNTLLPIDGTQFLLGDITPTGNTVIRPTNPTSEVVPNSQRFALDIIAREGLSIPNAQQNFMWGATDLQHQLSPSTTANINVTYGYRKFDETAAAINDTSLVDGADLQLRGSLRRSIRRASGVSVDYSHRRVDSQNPPTTSQDALVGWDTAVNRPGLSMNARVLGGVNHFRTRELVVSDGQFSPVLEGELSATMKNNTNFLIRYYRRPTESVGFGRNLAIHDVAGQFSHTFAGKLVINGLAEWAKSTDLLDADFTFDTKRFSIAATYNLTVKFGVGGGYGHNRWTWDPSLPQQNEHVWHIFVTFNQEWGPQLTPVQQGSGGF